MCVLYIFFFECLKIQTVRLSKIGRPGIGILTLYTPEQEYERFIDINSHLKIPNPV